MIIEDVLKGRAVFTMNAWEGLKAVEIIERMYSCIDNNASV